MIFALACCLQRHCCLTRQYKACSDLLEKINILPYEGATDGRQLYHEAWLMQAVDQLKRGKCKDASLLSVSPASGPKDLALESHTIAISMTARKNMLKGW